MMQATRITLRSVGNLPFHPVEQPLRLTIRKYTGKAMMMTAPIMPPINGQFTCVCAGGATMIV